MFTPSEAEVTKAKRIVEAMKQAAKEGKGAVSLDGRLIDIASIRQAEALLNKAAAMGMGDRLNGAVCRGRMTAKKAAPNPDDVPPPPDGLTREEDPLGLQAPQAPRRGRL